VVFDTKQLNGDAHSYLLPESLPRNERYMLSVQLHDGRGNVTQRSTVVYFHGPNKTGPAAGATTRPQPPMTPQRGMIHGLQGQSR
jgi:hypothetical protein